MSGNREAPPFLWQDRDNPDHLIGIVPDLLKEILEPLGVTADVRHVGNWARVQYLAKAGDLDMVAGAFMSSERFGYMDYILPPIFQLPTSVWVPAGEEFVYRHWPDLLDKKGSTLIDNSFGQNFDHYAEENLNIFGTPSIQQSFLMAQAGRVDYVLFEKFQGRAMLAREGKADQFTALEPPISSEGVFFTFPKKSPCNSDDFREAVADVLYKLVKDGRVEELITEYKQRKAIGD
ncbi:ABC transporter substrate-binding protein [Marinobacter sp. CHS3-4]|uniref:substrate-binding periplasmic protein n=1 Tax=Marinobacter sp. CHS3-4 TaxID=3045174 RepID=UPI0024B531D2|nr:ABC transporter substrate-binding protein [Marinobacter sp. CHS3-4]MDI9246057.1 ABC transporter substrate-binding protein [Marinobacter sp. CHS3-4]